MDRFISMGFSAEDAQKAMQKTNYDMDRALELLLNGEEQVQEAAPAKDWYDDSISEPDTSLRATDEPGILVSPSNPDVGPALTILQCNYWVQKRLAEDIDDLGFHPKWWLGFVPESENTSLRQELVRESAFVHMGHGRAQAHTSLVEKKMPNEAFDDLEDFLDALEPIKDLYKLTAVTKTTGRVDTSPRLNVLVDNGETLYDALNKRLNECYLEDIPPVIILSTESTWRDGVLLDEVWYPQVYTKEFEPVGSRFAEMRKELQEQEAKLRRKILDLRSYKGAGISEMLESTASVLEEWNLGESSSTLHTLDSAINEQRADIKDQVHTLEERQQTLLTSYHSLSNDLFKELGVEKSFEVNRYILSGALVTSDEYYVRYDGAWYYVHNDTPSSASFQTVQDAARDAEQIVLVYSCEPDQDSLTPSKAIKDFCDQEYKVIDAELEQSSLSSRSTPETSSIQSGYTSVQTNDHEASMPSE